jgi:TRL (tRNA-associated locus)-like protein
MKRSLPLMLLLMVAIMFSGCIGVMAVQQPAWMTAGPGIIYTQVQAGSLVLDNGSSASRSGESCSTQFLGMIATGDNRVETAMTNGGIKKAVFVNHHVKSFLFGLFSEVCTVVRGN